MARKPPAPIESPSMLPTQPQLVATDIDGTIISNDGPISARTVAAFQRAVCAGIDLVLVSARPPRAMLRIADEIGHRGTAIRSNGALIFDLETEELIRDHSLTAEQAAMIIRVLRERLPGIVFAVEAGLQFGHEPGYVPGFPAPGDTLIAEVEELVGRPIAKLLARHPDYETDELLRIAAEAIGDHASLHHSGGTSLLELAASGVSKAVALERLCQERGITSGEVVAFGDMPNDIPMLTWAGHGVAVGNAHPDLVAVADATTLTCEEDGVAAYLEQLLAS